MFMIAFSLIGIILLILAWTQIVLPLWKGKTLAPMLTPSQQREGDLAQERELTQEKEIKEKIKQEKQRRKDV